MADAPTINSDESGNDPADTLQKAQNDQKQTAAKVVSDVKTAAHDQAGALKEKALSAVGDVQDKAASQARSAAAALRDTAAGLEGELPWMRKALDKTADGLEGLTVALASGDINDALETVKGFARRQPALFLGLSIAAGFALARVGKTAVEQAQGTTATVSPNGTDTTAAASV